MSSNPEVEIVTLMKSLVEDYTHQVEMIKKNKHIIETMAKKIDNNFFVECPYILEEFCKIFNDDSLNKVISQMNNFSNEIDEQMNDICKSHEYINDTIDIGPERTGEITYCKHCNISKKGPITSTKSIIDDICIILTTTVYVNRSKVHISQNNPSERVNIYLKSIKQWLENTNFKIVVVENSGYPFHELKEYLEKYPRRFELLLYDETKMPDSFFDDHCAKCLRLPNDYLYTSKGGSEMLAINYAHTNSKLLKYVSYIFKITGRYFISNFEEHLTKDINIYAYSGFTQNNPGRCEVLGVHKNYYDDVFIVNGLYCKKCAVYHHHVEELFQHRLSFIPENKIHAFPVFQIEPTVSGAHYTFDTL
jgi:hypothetical protein